MGSLKPFNENPHEYDAFRAGLVKSLEPEGDLERLLADKIVADAWRLRRIPMLEAAVHRRSRHDRAIEKARDRVDAARSAETVTMLTSIMRMPARSNDRVAAERTSRRSKPENRTSICAIRCWRRAACWKPPSSYSPTCGGTNARSLTRSIARCMNSNGCKRCAMANSSRPPR